MYHSLEVLQASPLFAILTGHTCGEACWHARELVCRCSCGGANHGILKLANGVQPDRTMRKGDTVYTLAAVSSSYNEAGKTTREVMDTRFPGLDVYAYGDYRECSDMPVIQRKASASQLKWAESKTVEPDRYGDKYLVWALPVGAKYCTKASRYTANHSEKDKTPATYAIAI